MKPEEWAEAMADALLAGIHEHYVKQAEKVYVLGFKAGQKAEQERACRIIREMCPACDNGVAEVRQHWHDDFEPIECQYCGDVIRAIRSAEEAQE